jgi:hypothetical protein
MTDTPYSNDRELLHRRFIFCMEIENKFSGSCFVDIFCVFRGANFAFI